ncbi:MAG TPA: hypothetical protein QGI39_13625, partial [Gammaproteobacteria bacterium]|nr:hypothetical protein [Gammaproteobacteria bacterium]
ALKELLSLKADDEKKIEKLLTEILEKKRGELENVEAKNLEYDDEFAKIGKGDVEENDESKE